MTTVKLSSGNADEVSAYLAIPEAAGPHPGVVVLHDALGPTADSRRQADWLAAAGFVAIVPDLYSRGGRVSCLRAVMRSLARGHGGTFDDIEAARTFVAGRQECTGRVGVLGFCLGGGFALLAAHGHQFDAASVNYGAVPSDAGSVLEGACPIIGSFGGRDYTQRGAAGRLEDALHDNGIEHDVKEYPGVGHAFLNDHHGTAGWIMRRIGMGFDAPAADDARRRILEFFDRHLGAIQE